MNPRSPTALHPSASPASKDPALQPNPSNAAPGELIRVNTADGPMWVFATDVYVSRSLALYGEYCAAEANVFRQLVRPGQTVVEAGANLGSHSILLARLCSPGRLLAFEPQRRVFQVLCTNLTINGIRNAHAYPEALGAQDGEATIPEMDFTTPGNFGGISMGTVSGGVNLPVRVRRLDSLQLEALHFLKIDVEGWEGSVLAGATATIARHRPILYVENDRAAKQGALIAQVASLGYRLFWHVAPLFRPDNPNRVAEDVFNNVASLNMLCLPVESPLQVTGFAEIDPANWRSPMASA
jgi:FkbM family methyltransferase